jgi:hypothetical protein
MQRVLVASFVGFLAMGCRAPTLPPVGGACADGDVSFRCLAGGVGYDLYRNEFLANAHSQGVMDVVEDDAKRNFLRAYVDDDTSFFVKHKLKRPDDLTAEKLFQDMHIARASHTPGREGESVVKSSCTHAPEDAPHIPPWTRYYRVRATHERTKTNEVPERAMHSKFRDGLGIVRITLPEKDQEAEARGYYETNVGQVYLFPSLKHPRGTPGLHHGDTVAEPYCDIDHWYGSVEQVRRDWSEDPVAGAIATKVQRVDLVTMARIREHRFAAIGVYLVYESRESKAQPSAYIIEAGTADNGARQVFWANGFARDEADRSPSGRGVARGRSTFNPTMLSNPNNQYQSWVTIGENGGEFDPTQILIMASHGGEPVANAYITVTATIVRTPEVEAKCEGPTSGWGPKRSSIQYDRAGGRVRQIEEAAEQTPALPEWQRCLLATLFNKSHVAIVMPEADGKVHLPIPHDFGRCH